MTALLVLALVGVIDVQVTAAPCVEIDVDEVRRIAALELSTEAPNLDRSRSIKARLECSADAIAIRVDDLAAPRPLVRRLALATVEALARARTAALVITELVAESWRAEVAPGPVPAWQLRLALLSVARFVPWLVQWGGGLQVGLAAPGGLGVVGEFSAESGYSTAVLGTVVVNSLSGALHVGWSFPLGPVELVPSAGLRVGHVTTRGIPADAALAAGATHGGPWLGALVALRADVEFARLGAVGLCATATLEGGFALVGVRALSAGERVGGNDGPWAQLSLGVFAAW